MSDITEDFLENDPPIPGQNYACISCIWPEKVLRRKQLYFVKSFLSSTLSDPQIVKRLSEKPDVSYLEAEDLYESYLLKHGKDLARKFDEENDFRTNVRGIKLRGTYDSLKEARVRAEVLKRRDPKFETWIGQVGYWLPMEPNVNDDDVEQAYSDPKLNQLFSKKQENSSEKEEVFDPMVVAQMEAKRKEQELNKLVKTHNDNLDQHRDDFDKETQRKVDEATKETERRKAEQLAERTAAATATATATTSGDGKKKLKKKKHSHANQDVIVPDVATESTATSKEKIAELRNILDEREQKYKESLEAENKDTKVIAESNLNNNMMLESDRGQDIFDGKDADPWMQRKREAENNNIDAVIKKIL